MNKRELMDFAREEWGVCVMLVLIVASLVVMIVDVLDGGKMVTGPICFVIASVFGTFIPFLQVIIDDIKAERGKKR